jgi:hypothetical protein
MQAMRRRLLAGLTGLTALALGCDSGRVTPSEPTPQPASEQEGKAPSGETVVQIDNQNFNDMSIYLLDEGNRVFLGAVNGLSTGTLAIPRAAGSSSFRVRLLADPIGSSIPITTPSLSVGPGQTVYWTIGTTASNSFASAD